MRLLRLAKIFSVAHRHGIDQMLVEHDEPIGDAREIALFPPMTGG